MGDSGTNSPDSCRETVTCDGDCFCLQEDGPEDLIKTHAEALEEAWPGRYRVVTSPGKNDGELHLDVMHLP